MTTALMVRRIDQNEYDTKLWKTAYDLASLQRSNLLLVAGHSSFADDPLDRVQSAVYRTLNPRLADGVIISHTVMLWMTEEDAKKFERELPPLPSVALSIKLGDRACVQVNNAPGLRDLMKHLIRVHRCRRIVHVRGPQGNQEAQVREDIWRQELLAAGIEPQEEWLVQGHYLKDVLEGIGKRLVAQVGRDFDAVVACNDTAAFRVMEELQALGYRVPSDVIITGFDDNPQCQFSSPSLTTVRQPITQQMQRAWAVLREQLTSTTPLPDEALETSLVVRTSCSCGTDAWTPGSHVDLDAVRDKVVGIVEASGQTPGVRSDLAVLAGLHQIEIEALQTRVRAMSDFDRALNQVTDRDQLIAALHQWLPVLGVSRFALLATCNAQGDLEPFPCTNRPGTLLPDPPDFFRVLTSLPRMDFGPKVLAGPELSLDPWFSQISPFIMGTFPLVMGQVWHGLAFLEVSREAGLLERAIQEQLASVFDRLTREKAFRETTSAARVRELAHQEGMATLRRLVAEVAHEVNSPLGSIVSSNSSITSALAGLEDEWVAQVAGTNDQGHRAAQALVDAMRGHAGFDFPADYRSRRAALVVRLQERQFDDPEGGAEILVSLGFTGDEPQFDDLFANSRFQQGLLSLGRLADFRVSTRIIGLATDKIRNFVAKLRSTTQVEGGALSEVDLRESLETSLLLLKGELSRGVAIVWQVSSVPRVWCHPDEIQQVWTNLLRNAFHAMGHRGVVTLRLGPEEDWVRLDIVDTGTGISSADRQRIFTPFFSTKPEGEGLGLGLDISRRIVEGSGGRIAFESVPGLTTFSVWLVPVTGSDPRG